LTDELESLVVLTQQDINNKNKKNSSNNIYACVRPPLNPPTLLLEAAFDGFTRYTHIVAHFN
jgi:hypothetical protein